MIDVAVLVDNLVDFKYHVEYLLPKNIKHVFVSDCEVICMNYRLCCITNFDSSMCHGKYFKDVIDKRESSEKVFAHCSIPIQDGLFKFFDGGVKMRWWILLCEVISRSKMNWCALRYDKNKNPYFYDLEEHKKLSFKQGVRLIFESACDLKSLGFDEDAIELFYLGCEDVLKGVK